MSAREERIRLLDWLKETANKYNLKWQYEWDKYENIIFRIRFPEIDNKYYRIEIEFFTDEFNTRFRMAKQKGCMGSIISERHWKFVQYPKERYAPSRNSSELFEDYITGIIEKLTGIIEEKLKDKEKKMTVEDVLTLFEKKIASKGGRITFKSVDRIYNCRNKLIGLLDHPSVKVCEIDIFKIYDAKEHCIKITGIPHVTGIWTCVLRPSSDDNCKIENFIDKIVASIIEGLKECHREFHMSGVTRYLTAEELRYIDHDEEILEKVMATISKPQIKKVIFNNPATIVLWEDGTKTVVKRQKGERWDKEKGLAMAIVKKMYGNKGNYNDIFKKWCEEE